MNARIWLTCLLLGAVLGCQTAHPTVPSLGPNAPVTAQQADPTVHGRVDFSSVRQTQALTSDVVNSSTVSFIDTGTNVTVAAGKTDASGNFSLNLGAFTPVNGGTYILEAVKGLNNQAPGSNPARFRTIVQWNGTGWLSCTNAATSGSIVISALTTALAIESSLDSAHVAPANTIGMVNAGPPATLNIAVPFTNHPNAEISQLGTDLIAYLGADTDPVASVPSILPSITGFSPTSGGPSSLVKIQGSGFSPVSSGNTVTFNGATASVLLATPTSLIVAVPSGASTGPIVEQTARGTATGASFTLDQGVGNLAIMGFTPAGGRSGATVTLTGGFGSGTATPSVNFTATSGTIQATVTGWTNSSMTVTVPVGVAPGPITVQSGMVSACSASTFNAYPGDLSWMLNITPASSVSISAYTAPYPLCQYGVATWGTPPKYAYMVGTENTNVTYSDDVWMIPIDADGCLGSWVKMPSLTSAGGRIGSVAVVYGNYLYAIGGVASPGGSLSTIERAAINPADGTLSSWQVVKTMQAARQSVQAVVSGSTLYVVGGYDSAYRHDYESYSIAANGDLTLLTTGNLAVGGVDFPSSQAGCFISGNYLILAGGYANNGYSGHCNAIFPLGANGTLGAGVYGPDLNHDYANGPSAFINNEVYLYSSYDGNFFPNVAHATFDPATGTLGAWKYDSPDLPYDAAVSTALVVGNRIYAIGGWSSRNPPAGGMMSIIQSTTVDPNSPTKALSRWNTYGAVPKLHAWCGGVVGNKAWMISGYDNDFGAGYGNLVTEYVPLHDDGSVGPVTQGPTLNYGRIYGMTAIANGYLYVMGGYGIGASMTDTIERAQINTDGTLGSFAVMPNRLPSPNTGAGIAIVGKYLYLFAGTAGSYSTNIYRCVLNPDGSMGPFETYNTSLPANNYLGGAVVAGNWLIVYQGRVMPSGLPGNLCWMAPIYSDGSLGTFTSAPSMNTSAYFSTFGVIGNYLYTLGGWLNGGPASLRTERALLSPATGLGAWALYQPGGHDAMPNPTSHTFMGSPYIYKDRLYILGGNDGLPYNTDHILVGSIR